MTDKVKVTYGKVAERLGLGADVDGSTLLDALDEVKAEAAELRADTVAGGTEPAPPVATAELPAEPATSRFTPPPGLALVDEATLTQVRDRAQSFDLFRADLAARLGCDPSADTPTMLAAVDEALTEVAETTEGIETIDSAELTALRADAEAHRTARQRTTVEAAVRDGRIPPRDREHWVNLLTTSPRATETLERLPKGLIPVDGPRGYTGGADDVGEGQPDDVMGRLFGPELH